MYWNESCSSWLSIEPILDYLSFAPVEIEEGEEEEARYERLEIVEMPEMLKSEIQSQSMIQRQFQSVGYIRRYERRSCMNDSKDSQQKRT